MPYCPKCGAEHEEESRYCPKCGSGDLRFHGKKLFCRACSFSYYINPALAVGALIEDDQVPPRPENGASHERGIGAAAGDGIVRASADQAILESPPTTELHEESTVATVDSKVHAQWITAVTEVYRQAARAEHVGHDVEMLERR